MNYNGIIQNYLEKTNRTFDRAEGGFVIHDAIKDLRIDLRLDCDERGTLTLTAKLRGEVRPGDTQEVITAINAANAFANFGGFALSPADQTVHFRGYVRLRGNVDGELDYLFERSEKTIGRFAPSLCAVCENKLTADEFTDNLNRAFNAAK